MLNPVPVLEHVIERRFLRYLGDAHKVDRYAA
jgi:hypothetical protein